MLVRILRYACASALLFAAAITIQPAWAQLPTPNQPILVVQDSTNSNPYQNFVPEMLTTEGLNGYQVAQLDQLTAPFLASYNVVILPHLSLSSAQATLFANYVSAGGTLIGFRPDLQLASVFGVASLGTTLQEDWLVINTGTAYTSASVSNAMKFHGAADEYSLNGATSLATLYSTTTSPTSSPAVAVNTYGSGQAVLFSYDLAETIVLMRQGNPAWAGYPNNHDGFTTMRPSQMFMDQNSGQFWNDLGDGALNDIPQADIQLRVFSNALTLSSAAKLPLPRFWYFPNQNRAQLLMTGDDHSYPVADALSEISEIASYGGLFSYNMWNPFETVSNTQVNSWLLAGYTLGVHFNDMAQEDSSGVPGSDVTWDGMQGVINLGLAAFATAYPSAPYPVTTRDHYLIWASNDADGTADQVAQAKLFQNNGVVLDETYSAFPNRWGYMTGSGLPMKFLDPVAGTLLPVYEQATQYEDDIQLVPTAGYTLNWNQPTAQTHYIQSLSDSLTKYNTVITMLWHPENWENYDTYADAALQYAQAHSIPMSTTGAWLSFWQARAATAVSMPAFSSNTLTFTATGAPAGLTLLVPEASSNNSVVSSFRVDGVTQSFTVSAYQGIMYASVALTAGNHSVSVSYTTAGRILGQVSPSAVASTTTVQVQSGSVTQTVPIAEDGTYVAGPLPAGTYTVTPVSADYSMFPASRSVALTTSDVTGVNFSAVSSFSGETLFTTQTPVEPDITDGVGVNYELGTAITSDVSGYITAIRFWKASSESGTHTGNIWSSTGTLLASVTFTNETASGWQQQALTAPLAIAANTTYVASVNTANTYYVATGGTLLSLVTNQDLSSVVGDDGVYNTTPGDFPHISTGANYFRDVFFTPSPGASMTSFTVSPTSVTGGSTTTGTITLNGPAPAGGTVVSLSVTNPLAQPHTIQSVTLPGTLQANGSISWASVANSISSSFPSGTSVPVSGIAGLTATLTAGSLPLEILTECPATNCGWAGNFAPGASILWTDGEYADNGAWVGNGPLTITFSSPQRGLGFLVMPDEADAYTATICAFDSSNNPLGCAPFSGDGSAAQAQYMGIYDDTQEIASVTIDVTGTLFTHDFAIGDISVVNAEEQSATLPATLTIPAGQVAGTFQVATNEVSSSTNLTITASDNGTLTAGLTLTPPVLGTIVMNPASVAGGTSTTGTVTLNTPAPSGGAVVALTSNVPVDQPHTLQILSSASAMPANGSVIWLNQAPSLTAEASGSSFPVAGISGTTVTATNSDNAAMYIFSECPATNCGWIGNFAAGAGMLWVNGRYLGNGAWVGNAPLTFAFSNPVNGVGFNVQPDDTGFYSITICAFTSSSAALGCNTQFGNTSQSNPVYVNVYDSTQEISKITVDGGGLNYPHDFAIGDLTVANTTLVAAASVPASVTVPEGETVATFAVPTNSVTSSKSVTITGTYDGTTTSATFLVTPPSLSSVTLSPASLPGGNSSTGTVTLSGTAPTGGAVVSLSSSNNGVATPQASVTVSAGASTANFTVSTSSVVSSTPATITASYSGGQQTATLTVNPAPTVASVAIDPASVIGGSSATGTVTLTGEAPAGGATVTLSSDTPSAASVPASVQVAAGTTSATFAVTTSSVGSSTTVNITATYGGAAGGQITVLP